MEFKGITWVGNVYEKFETMCLEVEDLMYQDTVKYVENQVQTVAGSVKRFYSDVMQDLLPPSPIDPLEMAAADLFLDPYAALGCYEKPKARISKDIIRVDKQEVKDSEVATGASVDHSSSASSVMYSGQSKDGKNEHSNVCIKRNYEKNNHPPSELIRSITHVSKDLSRSTSHYKISENHEAAYKEVALMSDPASVEAVGCVSGRQKNCNSIVRRNLSIADAKIGFPMSKSSGKKGTKLRCTAPGGEHGGLSVESDAADTPTNSRLVSGSCITENTQDNGSSGGSGDCNTDVIEESIVVEPVSETNEQFDKFKLEETCVLVDKDELRFVSGREGNHRSCKKKIREAFTPKMKLARKQEYERLVLQYEDADRGSIRSNMKTFVPTLTTDADAQKLSSHQDFCESEWELL